MTERWPECPTSLSESQEIAVRGLVRARRLLVATIDDRRAIVGRVSPAWILSEVERRISWERVPAPLQRRLCPAGAPPTHINSNWLPKLEPELDAHVLAGVILFGARLFGRGTPDPEEGVSCREISHDLVLAGMIHATFGLRDSGSAFLPERQSVVDETFLEREFGGQVLDHVWILREQLAVFAMALERGGPMPAFPREYANAIAAIAAARLRLTARAAGDRIFSLLDGAKREELRAAGVDPGEPGADFPERPRLERDWRAARAAVALPGVDVDTVVEPVRDVLLRAVEHVLHHGTPAAELVGKYGSAIHNFHCALPLWEHYSPIVRRTLRAGGGGAVEVSGPFALGTLYRTSLEVTRYLHNVRRKGGGTGAGHSFLVSAHVERLLDRHLSVPVVAGADCHDVVEDGGFSVAGYDQNLELFALRFGAPLAALVSEVTDPASKEDGPLKAVATAASPHLVPMEQAYNLGQLSELRARATDPDVPFTLQGIVMKLADFGATKEEGLHEPGMMTGAWRHSGARVTWDHGSKGRIVQPLLQRLIVEVLVSRGDPFYDRRPGNLPAALIERLRLVLGYSFDVADLYLAQNLAILAAEHGVDVDARRTLIDTFLCARPDAPPALPLLAAALDERRLEPEVRRKGLSATHRLGRDGEPQLDLERLAEYCETARWRARARAQLELPPLPEGALDEVLARWEATVQLLPSHA